MPAIPTDITHCPALPLIKVQRPCPETYYGYHIAAVNLIIDGKAGLDDKNVIAIKISLSL